VSRPASVNAAGAALTPRIPPPDDAASVQVAAEGSPVDQIAIYGKGGIGKSAIATNLTAHYAKGGARVLHVGCDPKVDSAIRLLAGRPLVTVVDQAGDGLEDIPFASIVNRGRLGIDCIEAGGPEPGTGCAGRGVARAIEVIGESGVLERGGYDTVVFDVLGDVVCGGFAAPLRLGFARKVVIVISEQPMSLFAANNITKAVHRYACNGVALAGLVANSVVETTDRDLLARFAEALGTRILAYVPRDPALPAAENRRFTVTEEAPGSPAALALGALAEELRTIDPERLPLPRTLSEDDFFRFVQGAV
jgi:nitrogenase iron protein NifH